MVRDRAKRGGTTVDGSLPYGNGCEDHADCFTCPEPDCTVGDAEKKPQFCKYCGSDNISRYGMVKGVRRYFCCSCKRKFTSKDNLFHMKVPRLFVETAQNLWGQNLLYREIAQYLEEHFGYSPSVSSIHRWVRRIQSERKIP